MFRLNTLHTGGETNKVETETKTSTLTSTAANGRGNKVLLIGQDGVKLARQLDHQVADASDQGQNQSSNDLGLDFAQELPAWPGRCRCHLSVWAAAASCWQCP